MSHIGLYVLAFAGLAAPSADTRTGLTHNENFVISAPSQELAEAVLAKAEQFRKKIALDWLGEELPRGVGPTSIHVRISDQVDDNRTLVADDEYCRYHLMWLTTSRAKALGTGLAHEIAHTVLATRYRKRLAAWAEEGIASLQDDPERVRIRQRVIDWYARTGNWPTLTHVLNTPRVYAKDLATNALAASLVQFFLARGDRRTLLEFAIAGKAGGWDSALERCYGIGSVARLEELWRSWAAGNARQRVAAAAASAPKPLRR